jgi:hypothetical protein
MRSLLCASIISYFAFASFGCGGKPGTNALVGSYSVTVAMVSPAGPTDPDVMTVTQGRNGTLLLTFEAGISTDPSDTNYNGLVASGDPGSLNLASQPVHIDHPSGRLDGTLTGSGKINSDGSCDVKLHFTPTAGSTGPIDYDVSGARQ